MAAGPPPAPMSRKCQFHDWTGWPTLLLCSGYVTIRHRDGHFSMREGVDHCRRPVPSLGFCAHGSNFTDGVCARGCRSLLATQYPHTNKYLRVESCRYASLCHTPRKSRAHPILTSLTCACRSQTRAKGYDTTVCALLCVYVWEFGHGCVAKVWSLLSCLWVNV